MLNEEMIKELIEGKLDKPIKAICEYGISKGHSDYSSGICKYKKEDICFWSAIYIR